MKEDFYIGYLPNAPASHRKWGKKFVWIILASIVFLAAAITLGQKAFSKGIFEFGNQSELEGFLNISPVPHLRIYNDKGIYGEQIYKSVILTGSNKFGADEVVKSIFDANNVSPLADSFYVKLKGTLIYNDGKALFELTEGANSLVDVLPVPDMIANDSLSNDVAVGGFNPYKLETFLRGEIIDPKCYFGAMKPGSGKVHKSCAIRCISGGIPPVLKVSIGDANEYYILYGENGNSINQEVLDYIAEPVEIHGHFESLDDWQVLYINPEMGISKL
ncbi:MAG: hypothetical protein ACI94Y_002556 [Maribacter sp.]|jgi:hypothetical protein